MTGFGVMQIAIGVAVDQSLPMVRDPEYAYREHLLHDRLAEQPGVPLVLFIGSSRVEFGVHCQTIMETARTRSLAFNCGIQGAGLFLEEVCLNRLIASGIRPDIVFVEIMIPYLDARLPDQRTFEAARLSASEVSRLRPTIQSFRGPFRKWAAGRLLPLNRHQAELCWTLALDRPRDGLQRDLRDFDPHGWLPADFPPEKRPAMTHLAHEKLDELYREFQLSDEQEERLSGIIAECQHDGARVALLICPEGSEFRQLQSPEMQKAVPEMLSRLQKKYDVPLIDARDWMDDDQFYDMHHLHPAGARKFSARLAREGVEPLLESMRTTARR
jgi:hypothetical protein